MTAYSQLKCNKCSHVSLPLEPAAFSVKTTLQTRNRKVTSPHSAPMSLTRQVIFNELMSVFFLFIPPSPFLSTDIVYLICLSWSLPKDFYKWHSSPQVNPGQDANIRQLAKTLVLAELFWNVTLLRVHTCCFMQLCQSKSGFTLLNHQVGLKVRWSSSFTSPPFSH